MNYLTKSRFATAIECPRKLQYGLDSRYPDAQEGDDFLEALANGGHQVGALARLMYPGGLLVDVRGTAEQVRMTSELLGRRDVTLFEGTVRHENLLVRCDILEKTGTQVKLIEVKSKGYGPEDSFRNRNGHLSSVWEPYLYDVAYQAYVLGKAYPKLRVTPYLMLLDRSVTISVPGLNTKLSVSTQGTRVTVTPEPGFTADQISPPVLRLIDVSAETRLLRNRSITLDGKELTVEEFVQFLAMSLQKSTALPMSLGSTCKSCEFYLDPVETRKDRRSGWQQCMRERFGHTVSVPRKDTVFGLYSIREDELTRLLDTEPLELAAVSPMALSTDDPPQEKIEYVHRRELQWQEHRGNSKPFILEDMLQAEIGNWRWPLHFIDFETSRPALPYHVRRTPYDQILFQFSHHVLQEDGRLEHRSQFLEATPGNAPSLPALRALQAALSGNGGTVVHWWDHERTVLGEIRRQIEKDGAPDAAELLRFVESLIGPHESRKPKAIAGRLADLGRLVRRTAFYPGTGGSSSIKKVLPAALRFSEPLRQKYSAPIYGTATMPSLNFNQMCWVVLNGTEVRDPYTLLDPLFGEDALDQAVVEQIWSEESPGAVAYIANGGAAMIAYDRLQQPQLPDEERRRLIGQLFRYCELDTLAMVMVYEALACRTLCRSN